MALCHCVYQDTNVHALSTAEWQLSPCSHLIVSIIWSHSEAVPPAPCHVTTGQALHTCPGTRRHVASVRVRRDMMWRITHSHSLLCIVLSFRLRNFILYIRDLWNPDVGGPPFLTCFAQSQCYLLFRKLVLIYDMIMIYFQIIMYLFVPGLVRLTGKLRSRYLNVCMNIG